PRRRVEHARLAERTGEGGRVHCNGVTRGDGDREAADLVPVLRPRTHPGPTVRVHDQVAPAREGRWPPAVGDAANGRERGTVASGLAPVRDVPVPEQER